MAYTLYDTAHDIFIRLLQVSNVEDLLAIRLNTRRAYESFEPKQSEEFYTIHEQRQLILNREEDRLLDRAYMFGIFTSDSKLIGQVTISNVVRGVGQYADVGYFIDLGYQGQGYMTAALGLALQYAFEALRLHRIQAVILPMNQPSRRVLEKSGFQREGTARRVLRINNQWQDHETFAILEEEYTHLHSEQTRPA
ncbi:ribosomal-protein-alanine N-acetyltransferase [Paenibacillus sp. DS2015]|uniref:GNAT family N-acetyltransferase n=1 Tax=Paenibacillus sp. DS2015 TaxID=3373917 RepID=UPI003D1B0F5B